MSDYVAPYSNGWVVVVGGQWYGPGCTPLGGGNPPPAGAVWSDLTAAQNCYNAKVGGGSGTQPPAKPPESPNAFLTKNWPFLAVGAGFLLVLLRKR